MLRQAAQLCRRAALATSDHHSFAAAGAEPSSTASLTIGYAACRVVKALAAFSSQQVQQQQQRRAATTTAAAGAAAPATPQTPATSSSSSSGIVIDRSAVQRLKELQAEAPDRAVKLRVEVEGGGCSGFQYKFRLDDSATTADDIVFERDGVQVVCDTVSLDFLNGAVIEFEDSLMRSAFQIASNPNSESTCGCGTSFVAKM